MELESNNFQYLLDFKIFWEALKSTTVHILPLTGWIRIFEAQVFEKFLSAPDDFGVQCSLRNT